MKLCQKCGSRVPAHIVIDGKKRNLKNRLYCFECSPFKSHNTRVLAPPGPNSSTPPDKRRRTSDPQPVQLTCERCGRVYLHDVNHRSGHTLHYCNSCMVNTRRFERKLKCIEYMGGECQKCGYSKCSRAFHFHHLDPSLKSWQISGAHCRKWARVKEELDKCVLLCSNCHMELEEELELLKRGPRTTVLNALKKTITKKSGHTGT